MEKAIFVHIPKTAGSTLRTLITENYSSNEVLSIYGDEQKVLSAATGNVGKLESFGLIQGHIPYGIHRMLGLRDAMYFTFMRDPVDRFLSDVAMGVRHPSHGFHQILAAPNLSQEERLLKALSLTYYQNSITQYMSGAFFTQTISFPLLNSAIDNLWKCDFVGLAEEFSSSLLIMAKKLGWKKVIPKISNVRPDSDPPLPEVLRAKIEGDLAYDRAVYEVAKEHFWESKRKYGTLLVEAAEQLSGIIEDQKLDHPDAKYGTYVVGQEITVPLSSYSKHITAGSPLGRWLAS